MAVGRGEYPKLSTPLGLFPRALLPEGNNPSGVDNFGYPPIQRDHSTVNNPRKLQRSVNYPNGIIL
jgi:hypothetical protein